MVTRTLSPPKTHSFFLFGPRQTGKSTLIKANFKEEKSLVFNLLINSEYLDLASDTSLFRKQVLAASKTVSHIVVDEVQRLPELLNEVHALIEDGEKRPFILCGSSARKLKRMGANMLGGRAWSLKLHPLTHLELGDDFDLRRALEVGTLPKIYLEESAASKKYLQSYVETYIKEEIEAEALVRSTGTFLRFLFQAGHESGNLLNYSNIASESGTSHVTVKEYYQILEDTLVGHFLYPYHRSFRKRHVSHPKFYLFDSGVERAIKKQLGLDLLAGTPEFGHAFELWIINEARNLSDYYGKDFEFSFFRTENGAEVDLIVETPRKKIFAIEIKSGTRVRETDLRSGFAAFSKACKIFTPICVGNTLRPQKLGDVEILPWKTFFQRFLEWD